MLTLEEIKWLKRVQKVLGECPSGRLGFYTIGDAQITVYDKTNEKHFDADMDFPMAVDQEGAALAYLRFPANVISTVG